MFDVDSKDPSLGMSCPPPAFVAEPFLRQVSRILRPEGRPEEGGNGQALLKGKVCLSQVGTYFLHTPSFDPSYPTATALWSWGVFAQGHGVQCCP